jgi:hypothetical protein
MSKCSVENVEPFDTAVESFVSQFHPCFELLDLVTITRLCDGHFGGLPLVAKITHSPLPILDFVPETFGSRSLWLGLSILCECLILYCFPSENSYVMCTGWKWALDPNKVTRSNCDSNFIG